MKTVLMTLALVFCCCVCHAQGGNQKKKDGICADDVCMGVEFKYRFCTTDGKVVTKCSDDPNNERGMKLMKRKIPIDYVYQGWTLAPDVTGGDDTIAFYEGDLVWGPIAYPMFIGARMDAWIEAAAKRWMTNLCPPQGPDAEYQQCQVVIRWTRFGENIGPNFAVTNYNVVEGCSVDCPTAEIVLNQENSFMLRDEYNRPVRFIATERPNYPHLPRSAPYIYMDAYTTMLHEFGHWLGFPHSDTPDNFGEMCGDPNGIMKSLAENLEQKDLNWADECMFLKAYCCEKTKTVVWYDDPTAPPPGPPINHSKTVADEAQPGFGFTVAPNPATTGTITLFLHGAAGQEAGSLRIIGAAGTPVLEQPLQAGTDREVSVDISTLPNGFYLLQLVQGGQTHGRKFMIVE